MRLASGNGENMDKIIRAVNKEGTLRAFVAETTVIANEAVKIHDTYPVVTAALGRLMTACLMMGQTLKEEQEALSLQIKGDGPIGSIVTVSNMRGHVRGYVGNNHIQLPSNAKGKLDVGGGVGKGFLTVIRDLKLKEPYIGRTDLQTGEIAEDIAYYYQVSEQVPSAVSLGVLVDVDGSVLASGGFLVQLMPGASEEVMAQLEQNLQNLTPISTLIYEGNTPQDVLAKVLGGMDYTITDQVDPVYQCNCSRERLAGVLASLGQEELQDMIETDGKAEMVCHFCAGKYLFNKEQIQDILRNC